MIPYFQNTTKYIGLKTEEVKQKQDTEGFNELPHAKHNKFKKITLDIIKEPMFILLLLCGVLYLLLGDIHEGIILTCCIFVIMGIEFYQQNKTEKALETLQNLACPRALVIRNNEAVRIPGREVVTDDILILKEGDRIPADSLILESSNLYADESLLTGESLPVKKCEWINELAHPKIMKDVNPYLYSGSMITQGNGLAKVIATGINTEIGKIGKTLTSIKEEPTQLKKEIKLLMKKFAITGLILCLIISIIYILTRGKLIEGLLAGITLAMSLLPEEFPVILTVFLALGAWHISKKNVLTRKPSSIENLGSATVLCTDKTGTLTKNQMSITQIFNGENFYSISNNQNIPEEVHQTVEYGILASQINPFDPMEKAILHLGNNHLQNTCHIHSNWVMEREYPLTKELLAISRVFINKEKNEKVIACKGSPEAIIELCHLHEKTKYKYTQAINQMASQGLRIIGVAYSKIIHSNLPNHQHDFNFIFSGLIGFSDPIRENIPQAIKECYNAGIRVVMITGDYPITAINIAKEIGLNNPENFLSGEDIEKLTENELIHKIKNTNVFARIIPEQKFKIVCALKKNNEIVAMTGDGVNDAPALKAANIGIAMGEKGTDVARESASIVLMDDNFLSIVNAIKVGRRIFDNIQKALAYIFAIHIPIAGLSLIPVLINNAPLILWPVHIVFMELIIDPACSIVFETEKEEKNIMSRPPKNINTPFFNKRKIIISCLQGLCILITTAAIYFTCMHLNYSDKATRTYTFLALIAANIATIISNRSWNNHLINIIKTPNKILKWIILGALVCLIIILNTPILLDIFLFEKISLKAFTFSFLIGASSIIWFEIYKFIKYRQEKKQLIS